MQSFIANWGYVALFLLPALSAFCIPVGSELAMAFGGALASGEVLRTSHDHFTLGLVILVVVAGEITGGVLGYVLGRFGGRRLVDRMGRYLLLTHRDLDRAEAYLERRGDSFVFVGRIVPLLRSFVSIVAGLAEMSIWRFVAFSLLADAVFSSALCSIGYGLGRSWNTAVKDFHDVGYVLAALAVIAVGLSIFHRVRTLREERETAALSSAKQESSLNA